MTALPLPRLALIDLDGTLVDTVPDIAFCVDGALERLHRPAAGQANVRRWVGNGIEPLLERALAGNGTAEPEEGELQAALAEFAALYQQHTSTRSRAYPGVAEGIQYLRARDVDLACITNKAQRYARALLADLDLLECFSLVLCGDTVPHRKPDPEPVLRALRERSVAPDQAVLIGDSVNDVRAARAAGVPVICVTYGYNYGRDIRDTRPDVVIDSLAELRQVFEPD